MGKYSNRVGEACSGEEIKITMMLPAMETEYHGEQQRSTSFKRKWEDTELKVRVEPVEESVSLFDQWIEFREETERRLQSSPTKLRPPFCVSKSRSMMALLNG